MSDMGEHVCAANYSAIADLGHSGDLPLWMRGSPGVGTGAQPRLVASAEDLGGFVGLASPA